MKHFVTQRATRMVARFALTAVLPGQLMLLTLFALPARADSVTLAWDASASANASYRLSWGLTKGGPWNAATLDAGKALQVTVNGLEAGKIYYFVCRAYIGTSESLPSNEVAFAVSIQPPLNLRTVATLTVPPSARIILDGEQRAVVVVARKK